MKHHKNKLDNDDSILCEESLINMENGISFFYNEIESRDWLLERIKKYVEELYKLEGKNIYLILVGTSYNLHLFFTPSFLSAGDTAKHIVLFVLVGSATISLVFIASKPLSAHSTDAKNDFISITI